MDTTTRNISKISLIKKKSFEEVLEAMREETEHLESRYLRGSVSELKKKEEVKGGGKWGRTFTVDELV